MKGVEKFFLKVNKAKAVKNNLAVGVVKFLPLVMWGVVLRVVVRTIHYYFYPEKGDTRLWNSGNNL